MIVGTAILQDIPEIIRLQGLYLVDNLPLNERSQGFVTTPFTTGQIEYVISQKGLFVAKEGNTLAAYTFTGDWKFFSQWPIFAYMISRFPNLHFNGIPLTVENSFQYGPVCIDIPFRNQGLLLQLFETMRLELAEKFPVGVTFINKLNERSFNAHVKKLKWTVVDEFQFNNKDYWGLAYDMKVKINPVK